MSCDDWDKFKGINPSDKAIMGSKIKFMPIRMIIWFEWRTIAAHTNVRMYLAWWGNDGERSEKNLERGYKILEQRSLLWISLKLLIKEIQPAIILTGGFWCLALWCLLYFISDGKHKRFEKFRDEKHVWSEPGQKWKNIDSEKVLAD